MAINGRIQREGEVVHMVAHQIFDLSGDLVSLADRHGELNRRPAVVKSSPEAGPDPRDKPKPIVAPR